VSGPFPIVALILLGFFCCALTSLAFGLAAVRVLKIDFCNAESIALGYVIGSTINSTLTLALGLSGAIGEPVFITLTVGSLAILWQQRKWFSSRPKVSGGRSPVGIRLLLLLAFVCYGVIYFRQALSPEVSPDGTVYHLGLVNLWTHAGRVYRIVDIYAAFPEAIEMLYLFAFAIGRHSAAALVHLSFLVELPALMLLYGRRFGWNYYAIGFAAILIFASPTFGADGTAAYNDVALASACFAAIYLLQIWRKNRHWGALAGCGLLTGFAGAIKYSAFPLPLLVAAIVAWDLRKAGIARAVRAVALVLAATGIVCGPYLLRNWIWFDNPMAAFANTIFHNQWFHISTEHGYKAQIGDYGGIDWRELVVGLTIGNTKLPDSYGALFLLIPLGIAGLVWRQSRLIVATGLTLATVYIWNKDPRFLLPSLAFLAMGLGFTISRFRGGGPVLCAIAAIHLVISWPAFMDYVHYPPANQWRLHPISWRDALRITPEPEYLSKQSGYSMARQIETLVPESEPVLTFTSGAMQSYTTRRVIESWRSAYGDRMADLLFSKWHSPEDSHKRFSFTIPYKGVKSIRVVQQARDPNAMWNVDEVQLRSGGKTLAVAPAWKITASPNPWDVHAAFDGKMATRWRSWDSLRPGMFIRVDFGDSRRLDSVDVILDNREWITMGEGTWPAQVSLEVDADDGKRTRILPQVTVDPPADLRKESEEALKEGGIHYLLINDGDYQQAAFRRIPEAWNMHAIAKGAQETLFHLD